MSDGTEETVEARRERRARAIWAVQGGGLPWTALTAEERRVWYDLAEAIDASDREAGLADRRKGASGLERRAAKPGLRAHAPIVAAMQEVSMAAGHDRLPHDDPAAPPDESQVSVILRSVFALVLFLAAAAGLLYFGLALAG